MVFLLLGKVLKPEAMKLNPAFGHQACKMLKRAVISALSVIRKTAGRQFPAGQMIAQTFAAIALARTGFVAAITFSEILLGFAFHACLLIQKRFYDDQKSVNIPSPAAFAAHVFVDSRLIGVLYM
jgi:hypothetical protein